MNKIMLVILVFAVFAVPAAAAHEVYLVPQQSNAAYRSTADVEIWVGATENEFQSGQINMTYDHNCANVTYWKRNTTNFPMGGWSHYEGRVLITFLAADPLPIGKYMVGTLTIQCEKEKGGETVLAFAESSKLFDAKGNPVAVDWRAGTFKCSGSTRHTATTQTSSGGGLDATNTKTETPTASPASTVTPGMTAAAPPASTITPIPAAATPSPTASAVVSPAPTQPPEEKKELPGFEAVLVMLGVLVVRYLIKIKNE